MAIESYKISDGKSIVITAGATYAMGTWYQVAGFVGLCFADAVSGNNVAFNIEPAEYKTDQIDTADTMAVGTKIYWDTGNDRFTEDGEAGFPMVGIVTRAKDASNIMYFILVSQVGQGNAVIQMPVQADSVAEDVTTIVSDFNTLLGKLKTAGLMAT
jgi:predicted RecA/RadA family phage recombinase